MIFSREIEKFANFSDFGPESTRRSSVSDFRNILLSLFFFFLNNDQVENTWTGVHNATLNRFALSFSSLPWSVTGLPLSSRWTRPWRHPDSWETLFVVPTNDFDHITLPFFTQSISSNFCGHTLLIKGTKFAFIVHFSEFLASSGWERDIQFHPEAADQLQGAAKKSSSFFS